MTRDDTRAQTHVRLMKGVDSLPFTHVQHVCRSQTIRHVCVCGCVSAVRGWLAVRKWGLLIAFRMPREGGG